MTTSSQWTSNFSPTLAFSMDLYVFLNFKPFWANIKLTLGQHGQIPCNFYFLIFSIFPTGFEQTLRQHWQIPCNFQFSYIFSISNRFLANIMPTLANYMFFPNFQFFHIFTSDFFSLVIDELYSITSRHINRMTFPLKMTITYN